jgi:small subunit ribosomal protein S16
MLKIRLQRVGRKHYPSFRVVLTDSKNGPKSGKATEVLGNYDAKKDSKKINGERVKYWMSQGAQVSDTVHNLLVGEKIIDGKKINVLPKKSPVIDEEKIKAEAEAKEKAEAEAKAKAEAEVKTEDVVEEVPTEEVKEETPAVVEEEEKKEE